LRAKYLKFSVALVIVVLAVAVILIPFISLQSATAAPPHNPAAAIGNIAQEAGVTLEKEAGSDTVALGQVVSYTVTIKNEGAETINATLTDVLPEEIVLQKIVSATVGTAEFHYENNTLNWSGSIAQGEEAQIFYGAIPPTTSDPGLTVSNVAVLEFGGNTLEAGATVTTTEPDLGLWGRFVNLIAITLVWIDNFLSTVNTPYSFGFSIILFTVAIRLLTFPLNMQQIKSSKAMQELQPQLKEIQAKYKDDREKLAQEQMALYKEHGVNPLGGCLPMLVQMPIWFALYRALIQLSREGLLNEGFFWIPSLSGPVSDWGGGISWLWPLPPSVGWPDAIAYLVLPILLVVSQLYMQQMMTPATSDPQQASVQSIMKFMPFMFGYFALVVPSGLTLYWFTSNTLAIAQQYFTKTQITTEPTTDGAKKGKPAPVAVEAGGSADEVSSGGSTKSQHAKSKRRKKRRKR
jgi:YidC/Oxa1 family membrane protein insertase